MTPGALDFFAEAKARSLHKLDLYSKYLVPLVRKVGRLAGPGRPARHIWIVDGFAGANDHSHREIAATLHIRIRAVNNALQRARHKLREPIAI
jgi:hypothetical protein